MLRTTRVDPKRERGAGSRSRRRGWRAARRPSRSRRAAGRGAARCRTSAGRLRRTPGREEIIEAGLPDQHDDVPPLFSWPNEVVAAVSEEFDRAAARLEE